MKISFEIDDHNVVAEALDSIVLAHLKSSRASIVQWASTHPDDVESDNKIIDAMNVLIEYFGGSDAV